MRLPRELRQGLSGASYCFVGLTNQANRPRADGAQAPPASGPVEREVRRHLAVAQAGWGMLCHQMCASEQRPPEKVAWSTPSRTIRGRGSPGLRTGKLVPVDLTQIS